MFSVVEKTLQGTLKTLEVQDKVVNHLEVKRTSSVDLVRSSTPTEMIPNRAALSTLDWL
jgi:hypothetical protein